MIDGVLSRRIAGTESPVVVEFLSVPFGESGLLDEIDVSPASIQAALRERATFGRAQFPRATSASLGEMGANLTDRFGESYGRDFRTAIEGEWVPFPTSPSLRTLAMATGLITASGFTITYGGVTFGFVGQSSLGIVILMVSLIEQPLRLVAEDALFVIRQHVAAALDRKLADRDGILVHPANLSPLQMLPPSAGRVRATELRPPSASGTIGKANETALQLHLLVTNDSESGFTLLPARLEIGDAVASFRGFHMGVGQPRTTVDIGAHMAVELHPLFVLPGAVERGQHIVGTVFLETSHPEILSEPFDFSMTAFQ